MSRRAPTSRPSLRPETAALLAEFDASGQSAAAFARERGLPPWKIYGALNTRAGKRRRRGRQSKPDAPELVEVKVVAEEVPAAGAGPLELVIDGRRRVLVPPGFDEAALLRLLRVLATC